MSVVTRAGQSSNADDGRAGPGLQLTPESDFSR